MTQPSLHRYTLDDLKTHFSEAVEIMGAITAPQPYRNHLFALILLRRLNDVFEERCKKIVQAARQQGRSQQDAAMLASDPDEHRFFVPPATRWDALLRAGDNTGAHLERACAELERINPRPLHAVLTSLRFEHAETPALHEPLENLWRKLLAHLDKLPLGNDNLVSPYVLGAASTFLIEHATRWGTKRTVAETPSYELMLLTAELLQPEGGMRVCDPACGTGGGLIACTDYLQQRGDNPQNLSLFGQDCDADTWVLCQMNLLLHDLMDARIALGSAIGNPLLDEAGRLMQFDLVIAEPPFSLRTWEHATAAQTSFGRFAAGLPPPRHGELAFVQHVAATLNSKGRAAVIVPQGVLFRGGREKLIRAALLQADLIEAVIALPEGVLRGRKAPTVVLLLNRAKREERRGRVLFVDAKIALSSSASFALDELARRKIVALYLSAGEQGALAALVEHLASEHHTQDTFAFALREWADGQPAARATALADLETVRVRNDFNLNVGRYVSGANAQEVWNVTEILSALPELDRQKRAAEQDMMRLLRELGYHHE